MNLQLAIGGMPLLPPSCKLVQHACLWVCSGRGVCYSTRIPPARPVQQQVMRVSTQRPGHRLRRRVLYSAQCEYAFESQLWVYVLYLESRNELCCISCRKIHFFVVVNIRYPSRRQVPNTVFMICTQTGDLCNWQTANNVPGRMVPVGTDAT